MHVQRHSSWQAATAQVSAQSMKQRLVVRVAAASRAGREWGSGWGKKIGQSTVPQLADGSLLQQQQHARPAVVQQQLGVKQQKSATGKGYAAAYDAIADAIHDEFFKRRIVGCCMPTSVLFYEAVKAVNPAADPQFVLGYVVVRDLSGLAPPEKAYTCGRHLWVELGNRKYDIGRRVAAALKKEDGTEGLSSVRAALERPPDATYVGWKLRSQAESESSETRVWTDKHDAAQIKRFKRKSGRRLFWADVPKNLLAIRDDIISRNWLNDAKASKGFKGFGSKASRT